MKKAILLLLSLSALLLCACGSDQPPAPAAPDPNLGTYWCTSAVMGDMDLGTDGQWLRLEGEGRAVLFLIGEPDEGTWTLSGTTFTLTMGGETIASGALKDGVLTVSLLGMDCVFVREDAPPDAQSPAAEGTPADGTAVFTCYGGLYQVTYPTSLFRPSADGLTDLTSDNGTSAWITRLDSQEAADAWRTSFEAAASDADQPQTVLSLTVAGYPAQAMVYENDTGWHSEVIVNFGRDLGPKAYPMYAACLTFSGPTQESVWSEDIQAIVHSLTLL